MMKTLAIFCTAAAAAALGSSDPGSVAKRAIEMAMAQPINNTRFWAWSYGPGIQLSAMERMTETFPDQDYSSFVNKVLDLYASPSVPTDIAWQILNNQTIPWGYAVGDVTGLFPISYFDRAIRNKEQPGSDDLYVATEVASRYVYDWPLTLPDGTFSRTQCWEGQKSGNSTGTCLWADDQFMGLTLMLRLARHGAVPPATAKRYLDRAISIHQSFARHLQDRGQYPGASPAGSGPGGSHLFFHGANVAGEGTPSCCFWGRAQGWGLMAHAEVLGAIDAVDPGHPARGQVLSVLQSHLAAMAPLQAADGRWHQLVNDTASYLETSVTAMAVYAMSESILHGWIDAGRYRPVVDRAWAGLAGAVAPNGTVEGICCGTGIQADAAEYYGRSTAYSECQPGLGSVFRAAASYGKLERSDSVEISM